MQQLHAYWRMEYIEAPRYPAAMRRPFTELPALGDDRAALIVHRSSLSYLLLNRYPKLKDLNSLLIAVNQKYASDEISVTETDEIAVIPPVSGG